MLDLAKLAALIPSISTHLQGEAAANQRRLRHVQALPSSINACT